MKQFLTKFFVIIFLLFSIIETGCSTKQLYEVTVEELCQEFFNDFEKSKEKYKNTEIIVTGVVSLIQYPKDRFVYYKSIIVLGDTNYNSEKRIGNSLDFQMKNQESRKLIGKKIKIRAKLSRPYDFKNKKMREIGILMKDCEILEVCDIE